MPQETKNLWEAVPRIPTHITTVVESDRLAIAFPRFRNAWLQKWFVPRGKSQLIHIWLDNHGRAVWEQIDGERSIQEIAERLLPRFDEQENYELRVLTFVQQLYKQGFVQLA